LDLYRGQYDFNNFTTQVHDFDPGINPYPGGLFWTVPGAAVSSVELGTGVASMSMADLALKDYFNIPNGLFRFQVPVNADANASFDIHWSGPVTNRGGVSTHGSTGELVECQATMTWSARNSTGFHFVSHPAGSTSFFAQLGHISNGVFAG
jgi:hypothetical protein